MLSVIQEQDYWLNLNGQKSAKIGHMIVSAEAFSSQFLEHEILP